MGDSLADALRAKLGSDDVQVEAPLARYTAMRIGGAAEVLAVTRDRWALQEAVTLAWARDVPCRVLGGGSNVLVSDAGVQGLTVLNRARETRISTESAWAESGASLSTLARQVAAAGLTGLEWATGIPGSVGGAVAGNAGAWGSDVASTLVEAWVLEPDSSQSRWPPERFAYGYRSSVLREASRKLADTPSPVVLAAAFQVQPGDPASIETRVAEIGAQRRSRQPHGATCGSVFKNPPGDFAGRLIEAAGLKGTARGGARISPVHANFIVNEGDATAADVVHLITLVRERVRDRFGITLELEIELLGTWSTGDRSKYNKHKGIS
ncbi:MAG: UDP-N-acetylmuramate dehydrogenase [Anaerolineae bacterium]|jgi:UDP-N-acetylmuramate dehydrogenase